MSLLGFSWLGDDAAAEGVGAVVHEFDDEG